MLSRFHRDGLLGLVKLGVLKIGSVVHQTTLLMRVYLLH
jgi:hypothetical protein